MAICKASLGFRHPILIPNCCVTRALVIRPCNRHDQKPSKHLNQCCQRQAQHYLTILSLHILHKLHNISLEIIIYNISKILVFEKVLFTNNHISATSNFSLIIHSTCSDHFENIKVTTTSRIKHLYRIQKNKMIFQLVNSMCLVLTRVTVLREKFSSYRKLQETISVSQNRRKQEVFKIFYKIGSTFY